MLEAPSSITAFPRPRLRVVIRLLQRRLVGVILFPRRQPLRRHPLIGGSKLRQDNLVVDKFPHWLTTS